MTPARKYALQWFADHDRDPASVSQRRPPSHRIRRLMRREGQLDANLHLTRTGKALVPKPAPLLAKNRTRSAHWSEGQLVRGK
jgi:hypothetical protein